MLMKGWFCRWSTVTFSGISGLVDVLPEKEPSQLVSHVFDWYQSCATLAWDICTGVGAAHEYL